MTEPSRTPNLTPQFCFTYGALRGKFSFFFFVITPSYKLTRDLEFLRLSRSSIDDSINQNLNALVTPSRPGFDPSSTSHRVVGSGSKPIDSQACQTFKDKVLLPTWQARKDVLYYCGVVAASPDPDDPEATLREMEKEKDSHRVVDERLDPYSGRFFPREARTETLASLIRQENRVEDIVRSRTWAIVQQRCGGIGDTWEQAVEKWRECRGPRTKRG